MVILGDVDWDVDWMLTGMSRKLASGFPLGKRREKASAAVVVYATEVRQGGSPAMTPT